jgi:sec-independent protein translocase protein TatB
VGSLDPAKILVILVIALVVLGPERLPKIARQLGAIMREVSKIREQVAQEVRSAIPSDLVPNMPSIRPGSIAGFVSGLTGTSDAASETTASLSAEAGEESEQASASASRAQGNEPSTRRRNFSTKANGTKPLSLVEGSADLGDFAFMPGDPSMN